ncbi:hypothetical protein [Limoniibacter endophyticus]|uniref:Uncharacterized protein n=1 Tax=Limoniibacter endophyticus TaxID=1565040 RepID=A0A8J3GIS7_9HYPH|nr:hypothetical protein [Limoniibacter endophyticus]GHC79432.1 hypothetical protein GCM10010136_31960 [Limoniibacter endophyticus]
MTKSYHVNNTSPVHKAFKVRGGHQVVAAGKEADVLNARELSEAQIDTFARDGVKVKLISKGKPEKEQTPPSEPVPPFTAHDKGGGWWGIVDTNGQSIGKNFRTDEADAFNALDDEAKAAKVVELTKPE